MPKPFYKHKPLLDEHLPPRQVLASLNAHFDVKHISHDFKLAGLPDPAIYDLAVKQGRIILTINVKDFRPLIRDDSPGVIGIPENWPKPNTRVTSRKLISLVSRPARTMRAVGLSRGDSGARAKADVSPGRWDLWRFRVQRPSAARCRDASAYPTGSAHTDSHDHR